MTNFNAISMVVGKLGTQEIVVVLIILIVLFGPKYLPKLGQTFGNTIRGFKDGLKEGDDTAEAKKEEDGKTEA